MPSVTTKPRARILFALILAAVAALSPSAAEAGSGNYLIVTAQDYAGSAPLTQFANAKTAMGFTVSTYVVPPGTSRAAIKSHIQSLWGTPNSPKYLLIVGDTSGTTAASNTIPHWTGGGSHAATTDLPYACMGGTTDWYPDIFIGRFSVTSVSMLQNVVNKTLCVEGGSYPDPDYIFRAAFLATDDSTAQAAANHDWVISHYLDPAGFTSTRIYSPYPHPSGTQDITDAVNAGSMFAVYFGHSTSGGWWAPSFDQSNINALSNNGLYGLVMGWSCNTSHFDYDECFGETWQRAANKGAAAYLSASDYVWWGSIDAWESSRRMERYFFQSFFENQIWEVGPAWRAALQRILMDFDFGPLHEHTRNIFEEFVLLGDPALLLPCGVGFTMGVTPPAQSVCSPPTAQVEFTVNVGQVGGFAEQVTLAASGLPPGATAGFSTGAGYPPFTSVMTVSGLSSASAGQHTILITGTSASSQRGAAAGLSVSSDAPGEIMLTSPTNGADNIPLRPTFVWQADSGALQYTLDVATDADFQNIVHTATVTTTTYTPADPLGTASTFYWRVHGSNACGSGPYSPVFSFTTLNMLMPIAYDMLNGETGSYTYFDDTYDGQGDTGTPLAPLSGGVGDLTDGVIATAHWDETPAPYVSWKSIDPTINVHFAGPAVIETVTLFFDDSNGSGGVYPPTNVTIKVGGTTLNFPVTDPPSGDPFSVSFTDLNLTGDRLDLTLNDYSSSRYMMLSEMQFYGDPVKGACCAEDTCTVVSAGDCAAAGGEYQGDDTPCNPNPCAPPPPACLIISEVVNGTESGDHPRWIEITNTGADSFTFPAGGLIVQNDSSSDVNVDLDLTGVTIQAGQSYVINSTAGGGSGAFPVIYGFPANKYTTVPFGDGDDRYILTDTADGSHLIDIYGEFGVDGTGQPWEYTAGHAYRLPAYIEGNGGTFSAGEWYFGGVGSLYGADLPTVTHPAVHDYIGVCGQEEVFGDLNCDSVVDLADVPHFVQALIDPAGYDADHDGSPYPACSLSLANLNGDGTIDGLDIAGFVEALVGG